MIPGNQGIWTFIPKKVKKGRAHDISYQEGTFEWGLKGESREKFKGV